jgi:hypothetical protein
VLAALVSEKHPLSDVSPRGLDVRNRIGVT